VKQAIIVQGHKTFNFIFRLLITYISYYIWTGGKLSQRRQHFILLDDNVIMSTEPSTLRSEYSKLQMGTHTEGTHTRLSECHQLNLPLLVTAPVLTL